MSFLAKLNLEGEDLNILDCNIAFTQETDYTGRPCSKPRGGQIRLLIESTAKTDYLEWMISSTLTKKGEIVFFKRDNMSSLKTIKFSEAHCVEYTEHFNATDSQPLQIHLLLSAKEISVKGTTFKNNWPAKGN